MSKIQVLFECIVHNKVVKLKGTSVTGDSDWIGRAKFGLAFGWKSVLLGLTYFAKPCYQAAFIAAAGYLPVGT